MTSKSRVKCKSCQRSFEIDLDAVMHDKEIQCPFCLEIGENHWYNGEGEKSRSYVN